jgi:acyl-CoA thioester hydrolase
MRYSGNLATSSDHKEFPAAIHHGSAAHHMQQTDSRRVLATYPVHVDILTRYSDIDPQHHINNVAVAEFYQESRLGFHRALNAMFWERPHGARTLVARHEMDYLAEITYPGTVIVGVGVVRIGNSSYTLGSGMFQNDACVGVASTVLVHADANGPAPLPPAMREVLEKHKLGS